MLKRVIITLLQLLLAYASLPRYEGPEFDIMMAENDAKMLYKAGEKRLGTDEDMFINIFTGRGRAHLAGIDSAYHSMYGHSLEKVLRCVGIIVHRYFEKYEAKFNYYVVQAIKKETSGLFAFGLLSILRCAENPAKYFAKVTLQYFVIKSVFSLS